METTVTCIYYEINTLNWTEQNLGDFAQKVELKAQELVLNGEGGEMLKVGFI